MKDGSVFNFKTQAGEGSGVLLSGYHADSVVIIEILSGNARVEVGTECVEAEEGNFIYIPSKLVFRVEADGGRTAVRSISYATSIVEEYMEKIDTEIFYMFYVQSRNKISLFKPEHPIYEVMAYAVSEAYDEYASKDVCYKLPVMANIYLLTSALLRHYCGSRDELDRMVYHNVMRLRPTLDYITENCGEKIYIETLAEMISVSPDYFTKMFKESIGKTPIDYINTVRVNRALELLSVSDVPINEIAERSGFSNANYFHKIFKQYMNTSPLAYRKSVSK